MRGSRKAVRTQENQKPSYPMREMAGFPLEFVQSDLIHREQYSYIHSLTGSYLFQCVTAERRTDRCGVSARSVRGCPSKRARCGALHVRRLQILFCFLDCKNLGRVRSDNLIFRIRCDDFNRDVLESGEEYSLPHIRFEEEILFFVGKFEGLLHEMNRSRRLPEQHLDRRVCIHRQAYPCLQTLLLSC